MRRRRTYEPNFRARVALEAIKGMKTMSQLATEYKVHPNLIAKWKKEATLKFPHIFAKQENSGIEEAEMTIENLYKEIGKLKVENDFLKKKLMT